MPSSKAMRSAIFAGIRAANVEYEKWSNGWWVTDSGVEGLMVGLVHREAAQFQTERPREPRDGIGVPLHTGMGGRHAPPRPAKESPPRQESCGYRTTRQGRETGLRRRGEADVGPESMLWGFGKNSRPRPAMQPAARRFTGLTIVNPFA